MDASPPRGEHHVNLHRLNDEAWTSPATGICFLSHPPPLFIICQLWWALKRGRAANSLLTLTFFYLPHPPLLYNIFYLTSSVTLTFYPHFLFFHVTRNITSTLTLTLFYNGSFSNTVISLLHSNTLLTFWLLLNGMLSLIESEI